MQWIHGHLVFHLKLGVLGHLLEFLDVSLLDKGNQSLYGTVKALCTFFEYLEEGFLDLSSFYLAPAVKFRRDED